MSVCATVDIDLLRRCFDLKPFNGLRKLQVETSPTSNRKQPQTNEREFQVVTTYWQCFCFVFQSKSCRKRDAPSFGFKMRYFPNSLEITDGKAMFKVSNLAWLATSFCFSWMNSTQYIILRITDNSRCHCRRCTQGTYRF